MDDLVFEAGAAIDPGDYRRLRAAVGWATPELDDAELTAALAATWNVVARRAGEAVAIGRLLDDGALYASIWDMIVVPELQRSGLGERILRLLVERAEGRTIVALVATDAGRPLYERHGFTTASRGSVWMLRRG